MDRNASIFRLKKCPVSRRCSHLPPTKADLLSRGAAEPRSRRPVVTRRRDETKGGRGGVGGGGQAVATEFMYGFPNSRYVLLVYFCDGLCF